MHFISNIFNYIFLLYPLFIAKLELLLTDAPISRNVENGEQFSHNRAVQTDDENLLSDDDIGHQVTYRAHHRSQ